MKIYTRTGDAGQTSLYGGLRVGKSDPRVEAYGTVDETNAAIGVARSLHMPDDLDAGLRQIQEDLFVLGAELACAPEKVSKLQLPLIDDDHVTALERWVDRAEAELTPLEHFILPAGTTASAALHLARTTCRRAERRVHELTELRPALLIYLNRLSDLLFVLARLANARAGVPDVPWQGRVRT